MKKNQILTVPIDECYPNDYNANRMSESKLMALIDTIKRNGQTHPIQVVSQIQRGGSGKYKIIGGEHKWKAMKALKYKEVEILVRHFEDEVDEKLGSLEDNLHGNTIPIKEAMIVASATKKYPLSALERRLGESSTEVRDKLLLAGDESKLKKIQESMEKDHLVEISFVVDADADQNAERFIKEAQKFAKKLGAEVKDSKFIKSKTKESVAVLSFMVSDLQKNVIEQAIGSVMKAEKVGRGRSLELITADFLAK